MNLEQRAKEFALKSHFGQKRKYSGVDYITHPESVANIVRSVEHTEEMLAAAWLHDVVEDCNVSTYDILENFGYTVQQYVYWLTDVSLPRYGNRARRKEIDRLHIAVAPREAKTIKLADLLDNTSTIVKYDPEFAKVYLKEKVELLGVLKTGNSELWEQARKQVNDALGEFK
jgi:(p)ppGpp synthase/HD superfamily hydrolase